MNFRENVKNIVEPLLLAKGFSVVEDYKGFLQYDNGIFSLSISFNDFSYEVACSILFSTTSYEYQEVKEYFSFKPTTKYIQIVKENVLIAWLNEVNELLNEHLNFIIGNYAEVEIGLEKNRAQAIKNSKEKHSPFGKA